MKSNTTPNLVNTSEMPFILQGTYFEVVAMDTSTGKVSATCLECKNMDKMKVIHGNIRPTSNFVSHMKVILCKHFLTKP